MCTYSSNFACDFPRSFHISFENNHVTITVAHYKFYILVWVTIHVCQHNGSLAKIASKGKHEAIGKRELMGSGACMNAVECGLQSYTSKLSKNVNQQYPRSTATVELVRSAMMGYQIWFHTVRLTNFKKDIQNRQSWGSTYANLRHSQLFSRI